MLGVGCADCETLYEVAKQAAGLVGVEAQLEKVTDHREIMKHGLMQTPELVVNEKVTAIGRR